MLLICVIWWQGTIPQQKASQSDAQGSSFTLQLFQRTLNETLDSFQKSIHEDVRNVHLEILRQFHLQEVCIWNKWRSFSFFISLIKCLVQQMEMSTAMNSILENQAELLKEVKSLRKENEQLRQLLWWMWIRLQHFSDSVFITCDLLYLL